LILKLLFLPLFFFQVQDVNLNVRARFHKAIEQGKDAADLQSYLHSQYPKTAYLLAYEGALNMVQAKHLFLPTSKYTCFKKGKLQLESQIQANPSNIEFRYLRLIIQSNVPSFLNYSSNQNEDKNFLVQQYQTIQDNDLKQKIKLFLLKNSRLNEAQLKILN